MPDVQLGERPDVEGAGERAAAAVRAASVQTLLEGPSLRQEVRAQGRHREVGLGPLEAVLPDQGAAALDPPAAAGHLAGLGQAEAQPEAAGGGVLPALVGHAQAVAAVQGPLARVVVPREERAHREQPQVVQSERVHLVGGPQVGHAPAPGRCVVRRPAALERGVAHAGRVRRRRRPGHAQNDRSPLAEMGRSADAAGPAEFRRSPHDRHQHLTHLDHLDRADHRQARSGAGARRDRHHRCRPDRARHGLPPDPRRHATASCSTSTPGSGTSGGALRLPAPQHPREVRLPARDATSPRSGSRSPPGARWATTSRRTPTPWGWRAAATPASPRSTGCRRGAGG